MNCVKCFQRKNSEKAIEVQNQWGPFKKRSKIQTLVRKSRGIEGVRRKYSFTKVTREENRKYMSLV